MAWASKPFKKLKMFEFELAIYLRISEPLTITVRPLSEPEPYLMREIIFYYISFKSRCGLHYSVACEITYGDSWKRAYNKRNIP